MDTPVAILKSKSLNFGLYAIPICCAILLTSVKFNKVCELTPNPRKLKNSSPTPNLVNPESGKVLILATAIIRKLNKSLHVVSKVESGGGL